MLVNFFDMFKNSLMANNASFQWGSDEIKVLLVTSAYTFNASYPTIGALEAGEEVSGTGYTAGGKTLTGKSQVGSAVFADNLSWEGASFTARGAIIYKAAGGAMMAHVDFESNISPSNEELQLNWHASGIFILTTS